MLKGVLGPVLLGLLSHQADYGYSIVERLRRCGFSDLKEGTVYPALTRLERNGWLSAELVRSESGPARRYYAVTDDGRTELDRARIAWSSLSTGVDAILNGKSTP